MNDNTLQAVIVSNTIVMSVFILQKIVEYLFNSHTKKNEKQEHTIDELVEKFAEIQSQISALKAQVEITLQHLFKIHKVERDVNALAEKVRKLN